MNDVCIALNYYVPYVSGLTNVARDIAEELVRRGKKVTVVTSQHDDSLPLSEIVNGVRVIRSKVNFRFGKGVFSIGFLSNVIKETRRSKILNIHAPMLEAGFLSLASKCPVVLTYQCDVSLPHNVLGVIQNFTVDISTRLAAKFSKKVVVSTEDYARHSRVSSSLVRKMISISPTCHQRQAAVAAYRDVDCVHVGFLGRLVEEKGVEFLVQAFSEIESPDIRLLIGGDFEKIAGGSVIAKVKDQIRQDSRIKLLGFIPDDKLDSFYASLDIFCLPSVNPFEAFGIVQVEALMLGIPVVATDMPGVRMPIKTTGLGRIVPPRDPQALKNAILDLANGGVDVVSGKHEARRVYSLPSVVNQYESLFDEYSEC